MNVVPISFVSVSRFVPFFSLSLFLSLHVCLFSLFCSLSCQWQKWLLPSRMHTWLMRIWGTRHSYKYKHKHKMKKRTKYEKKTKIELFSCSLGLFHTRSFPLFCFTAEKKNNNAKVIEKVQYTCTFMYGCECVYARRPIIYRRIFGRNLISCRNVCAQRNRLCVEWMNDCSHGFPVGTGYGIASSSIKMWQMTGVCIYVVRYFSLLCSDWLEENSYSHIACFIFHFLGSVLPHIPHSTHTNIDTKCDCCEVIHNSRSVYHFSIAFEMTFVWSIWPGKFYSSEVQTMK